jgi:type II secretory pathway pseudopilin PulG
VEIMIVVAIIGLLAAIAIPNFLRARMRAQATSLLEDVRLIDAAKNQFALENRNPGDFVPKVADIRPYLQVGSRLYNTTQLSNFRDIFARPIVMGDLNTPPLIDNATRDYFAEVIPDAKAFWGVYCQ